MGRYPHNIYDVAFVSLFVDFERFHTLFWCCFLYSIWASTRLLRTYSESTKKTFCSKPFIVECSGVFIVEFDQVFVHKIGDLNFMLLETQPREKKHDPSSI